MNALVFFSAFLRRLGGEGVSVRRFSSEGAPVLAVGAAEERVDGDGALLTVDCGRAEEVLVVLSLGVIFDDWVERGVPSKARGCGEPKKSNFLLDITLTIFHGWRHLRGLILILANYNEPCKISDFSSLANLSLRDTEAPLISLPPPVLRRSSTDPSCAAARRSSVGLGFVLPTPFPS